MSATVTWLESVRFEFTYTSWGCGPGLAAGSPKWGHPVLSGLTNREPNQPWKWKSSSYTQSWFSPARVKLLKLMEGFAALALAPVPEDHWQHSMLLFHSSSSQRIGLEEKKTYKEKSQLFGDTRLNQCYWFDPSWHFIHWNVKLSPSKSRVRASRTDKDDSGWPDVILTRKVVILMFDYSWEEFVQPSEDTAMQEPMKEGLSCLEGQGGTSGSQRKLWWGHNIFLWLIPDL